MLLKKHASHRPTLLFPIVRVFSSVLIGRKFWETGNKFLNRYLGPSGGDPEPSRSKQMAGKYSSCQDLCFGDKHFQVNFFWEGKLCMHCSWIWKNFTEELFLTLVFILNCFSDFKIKINYETFEQIHKIAFFLFFLFWLNFVPETSNENRVRVLLLGCHVVDA